MKVVKQSHSITSEGSQTEVIPISQKWSNKVILTSEASPVKSFEQMKVVM